MIGIPRRQLKAMMARRGLRREEGQAKASESRNRSHLVTCLDGFCCEIERNRCLERIYGGSRSRCGMDHPENLLHCDKKIWEMLKRC